MPDIKLPPAQVLAVNYAFGDVKPILLAFLQFDWRMAQFVSQVKEPIVAQLRIAWWRDELAKRIEDRPHGDPILDALSELWSGEEAALISLANGWEALLAEPPLPNNAADEFVTGRADCFAAIARLTGFAPQDAIARKCGLRWAFADLASRISDDEERVFIVEKASKLNCYKPSLPRQLRCLKILDALAARAINRGGGPLMSGRADLLVVMRLGLFGR